MNNVIKALMGGFSLLAITSPWAAEDGKTTKPKSLYTKRFSPEEEPPSPGELVKMQAIHITSTHRKQAETWVNTLIDEACKKPDSLQRNTYIIETLTPFMEKAHALNPCFGYMSAFKQMKEALAQGDDPQANEFKGPLSFLLAASHTLPLAD